jgi:tetratricopeptide (TPR) repeat protein
VKKDICFTIAFLLGSLISAYNTEAQKDAWVENFFIANQAYKENRFQDAIDGYKQIIDSGHKNGHLYYNLGNAYFRMNELGKAILCYERARLLIPRDADLNFNLRYAGDQVQDAVPRDQGFMSITFVI